MRLSEAMRIGAMLKPQGRGEFYKDGHTCALGAAVDAVGGIEVPLPGWSGYDVIRHRWPQTNSTMVKHPETGVTWVLLFAIEDLNDQFRWTRERIADWVATIEQQQDAEAAKLIETPVPVEA